jgi:hypothetical protein
MSTRNFFWPSDSWWNTHLQENFRNPSSRDKISLTMEYDILKCIAILGGLTNENFSRKCSNGGPKIESCIPGRASSRQEISPVLKRANNHEIWACEYPSEPIASVSSFWIFQAAQPFSKKSSIIARCWDFYMNGASPVLNTCVLNKRNASPRMPIDEDIRGWLDLFRMDYP